MRLLDAERLCLELMADHGLINDWTFKWSRSRRVAGYTNYTTRTISLSKPIVEAWEKPHVTDTILHEIAHALAGVEHGHDWYWRQIARRIGCNGERTYAADLNLPKEYIATCVDCGRQYHAHRSISGRYCRCSHGLDWDERPQLVYRKRQSIAAQTATQEAIFDSDLELIVCSSCGITKAEDCFGMSNGKRRNKCKECVNRDHAEWRRSRGK